MDRPRALILYHTSKYPSFTTGRDEHALGILLNAHDPFVSAIAEANQNHARCLETVGEILGKYGVITTWKTLIEDVPTEDFDWVISVGGDGTVLHASHSIGAAPVLGVNSSPMTSKGFFTCATRETFESTLKVLLGGDLPTTTVQRMEIRVDDKVVTTRTLNDALFCHDCPASATRYIINYKGLSEDQLSSGVWVSTAAGSTAAIQASGGKVMRPGSKRLQFRVREPFACSVSANDHVAPKVIQGYIDDGSALTIRSKTGAAKLYVDGPHVVFPVDFGQTVVFRRSKEPLNIYRAK